MTEIAATAPVAGTPGRARRGVVSLFQGLALALFGIPVALFLLIVTLISIAFIPLGIGIVTTPPLVLLVRAFANLQRRFGLHWFGTPIARPYKPTPQGDLKIFRRLGWVLGDPGTWRDLLWLLWACSIGFMLALFPLGLVSQGIYGWVLMCGVWEPIYDNTGGEWYGPIKVTSQARAFGAGGLGTVFVLLGLLLAPYVMKAHALVSRSLLAPTKEQALRRVAELTETRTAAVDASAAELRRIERDLHDGAQARLVAMGMTLGAAEHLMESDPVRARQMIAEARDASVTALNELRGLVRGILPPVLAERGLGDAVRAGPGLPGPDRRDREPPAPARRPGRVGGVLRGVRDADQRDQARPRHPDLDRPAARRVAAAHHRRRRRPRRRGPHPRHRTHRRGQAVVHLRRAPQRLQPRRRADADHDGGPGRRAVTRVAGCGWCWPRTSSCSVTA